MKLRTQLGKKAPPENRPNPEQKSDNWYFQVSRYIDLNEDEKEYFEDRNLNKIVNDEELDIGQDESLLIITFDRNVEFEKFFRKRKKGVITEMTERLDRKIDEVISILSKDFNS